MSAHSSWVRWIAQTLWLAPGLAWAAGPPVATDGSLGPVQSFTGNAITIPSTLGTTRGSNLFHSFSRLDVPTNGNVTFDGPAGIQNVLARVTGGAASNIDGTLGCSISGANLILINPSGVVFGRNAALDVSGSFVVTTADELRLSDGGRFVANAGGAGSVLTSAAPAAFGFLSPQPASIIDGAVGPRGLGLVLDTGNTFSAVAGNITLSGNTSVFADSGRVNLIATGPGVVSFDPIDPQAAPPTLPPSGSATVQILQSRVNSNNNGRVLIRAGRLQATGSSINVMPGDVAAPPGRGVDIQTTKGATFVRSTIETSAFASASGRPVRIVGGSVRLLDHSLVNARSNAAGSSSSVRIFADRDFIIGSGPPDGFAPSGQPSGVLTLGTGAGNAGDINITAGRQILIQGLGAGPFVGLEADTDRDFAQGPGGASGNVAIASPLVTLLNAAQISVKTESSANGGEIRVDAGTLIMNGQGATKPTLLESRATEASRGIGGPIVVHAGNVELIDGGVISATTLESRRGGDVTVSVDGLLRIIGTPDAEFTGIFSRSTGTGAAGQINVSAGNIFISGAGGGISVAAPTANGGNLGVLSGSDVRLDDGASISASAGLNGGNISLGASGIVRLTHSTITGAAGGAGGQITISNPDPRLVILDRASTINGIANQQDVLVTINAAGLLLSNNSAILTDRGQFNINTTLAETLGRLAGALVPPGAYLQTRCIVEPNASTFIVTGQGGLPPAPGGWVRDDLAR